MDPVDDANNFLDDDIMKVLTLISYTKEKNLLARSEIARLEKLVQEKSEEISKIKEAEKTQINCLEENKKLISDQQTTISKLITVKEDIKKYKDVINARDQRISDAEKEKYGLQKQYDVKVEEIRREHIKEIDCLNDEIKDLKNELSLMRSEAVCKSIKAEEDLFQAKAEKDEQINKLVLDYEEKIQRAQAQYIRMKDEMQSMVDKSNASIGAYKEKISDLEIKLNQRTNVVKPNISRLIESSKTNQNRASHAQYSTKNTTSAFQGNSFQNKDYVPNYERPLSRMSNVSTGKIQDYQCPNHNNYGSFQLSSKQNLRNTGQKYDDQMSVSGVSTSNYETYRASDCVQETGEEKRKSIKRKLFSKFTDEFEEID